MSYINITDEAINGEKVLLSNVIALQKDLYQGAKNLITVFQENQTGLGYHSKEIYKLLEDLVADSGETGSVKKLVKVLKFSSTNRQQHREEHDYNSNGQRHR